MVISLMTERGIIINGSERCGFHIPFVHLACISSEMDNGSGPCLKFTPARGAWLI